MSIAAIRDAVERSAAAPAPGCASCLAFHADVKSETGECRRYAPRPGVGEAFAWPVVDGDDWCVQHRSSAPPFQLSEETVSAYTWCDGTNFELRDGAFVEVAA